MAVWGHKGQVRHLSPLPWRRSQIEVLHAQVGDFLHACAGVVQEQQEDAITQRVLALPGEALQERYDIVALKKAGFRGARRV